MSDGNNNNNPKSSRDGGRSAVRQSARRRQRSSPYPVRDDANNNGDNGNGSTPQQPLDIVDAANDNQQLREGLQRAAALVRNDGSFQLPFRWTREEFEAECTGIACDGTARSSDEESEEDDDEEARREMEDFIVPDDCIEYEDGAGPDGDDDDDEDSSMEEESSSEYDSDSDYEPDSESEESESPIMDDDDDPGYCLSVQPRGADGVLRHPDDPVDVSGDEREVEDLRRDAARHFPERGNENNK